LVAKGFLQKYGVDFTDVYALEARLEIVRLVVVVASWRNWQICQLDVKSTFLNGPLGEEVYVRQLPGFEVKGEEMKVYRLRKALYGLRQAPWAWNKLIGSFLCEQGFVKSKVEFGVYVKKDSHRRSLIVCLYVDDLIVT